VAGVKRLRSAAYFENSLHDTAVCIGNIGIGQQR